jgi:[acyl-carrier-protein] S-malonyltransferase
MEFSDASVPVVANYDNAFITKAGEFAASLINQIASPVRWDSGVRKMIEQGVTHFVELGHGKVLSGMMRRIDKSAAVLNVMDPDSLNAAVDVLAG